MIQNHSDHGASKGSDKSLTRVDSAAPLMHHDPSDFGSLILIQIIAKERTLRVIGVSHYSLREYSLCMVKKFKGSYKLFKDLLKILKDRIYKDHVKICKDPGDS